MPKKTTPPTMRQIAHTTATEQRDETTQQSETDVDTEEQNACPECGGSIVTEDGGERYCQDCGIVVDEDNIDHGPEWRAYSHEEFESKARTGSPETMNIHDKGLSTVIDWRDKDANGNALSAKKKRKMKRLRRWDEHGRTKNSKERNLKKALSEINRMTAALDLPDNVNQMASVIYRRAVDDDLLVGRSIEGIATAALYCACRKSGVPRTLAEVSRVSRVEQSKISSAYRYLSNELGLELPPADPRSYLPGVASSADVPNVVEAEAENLIKAYAEDGQHSGRHTKGVAAAALYTANKLLDDHTTLTQKDAADAGGVCVVTIRSRHEELLEYESAVETDPSELDTTEAIDGDSTGDAGDEGADASYDIDADGVALAHVEDEGVYVATVPEHATQNDVLVEVVNALADDHGLFDEIETPWAPPRWQNYAVVDDPDADAPEQAASWKELDCGQYVNTKIGKGQKKRLMERLGNIAGITITLDDRW